MNIEAAVNFVVGLIFGVMLFWLVISTFFKEGRTKPCIKCGTATIHLINGIEWIDQENNNKIRLCWKCMREEIDDIMTKLLKNQGDNRVQR